MPTEWHLLDTNILLRLGIQRYPGHNQVHLAIRKFQQSGTMRAYTLQKLTEFWNVATRPVERNGVA